MSEGAAVPAAVALVVLLLLDGAAHDRHLQGICHLDLSFEAGKMSCVRAHVSCFHPSCRVAQLPKPCCPGLAQ